MPEGSDKRRDPRFVLNQPVSVKILGPSESKSGTGGIFDISERGLSFTFRRPLEPGDQLTIQYEGCLVRGEVRHCRDRQFVGERRYLIGVAVIHVVKGADIWL